jgi:hypothetical protein
MRPSSVMMMWKENEFSNEEFHGSEEHPEGIELLLELLPGKPEQILPRPLDLQNLADIHKTFDNMKPEELVWWEEVLQVGVIPNYSTADPPEDYFNFEKLSYATWQITHPLLYQAPERTPTALRDIQVNVNRGIAVTNNRVCECFVGDFVSI